MYDLEDVIDTQKAEFIVTNDIQAEWCVKKIKEDEAEVERLVNVIDDEIEILENKKQKLKDGLVNKTGFLKGKLAEYFETVEKKELKTCFKYRLPSADLVFVKPSVKYERDDAKIIDWLTNNNQMDYIKIKPSVNWEELKKTTFFKDIDGVTEVMTEARFEVK